MILWIRCVALGAGLLAFVACASSAGVGDVACPSADANGEAVLAQDAETSGAPCTLNADCRDDQVCAATTEGGECVTACVTACPDGAGLLIFDGCHCRTATLTYEIAAETCADGHVAGYLVVSPIYDLEPWADPPDTSIERDLLWRGDRNGALSPVPRAGAAAACAALVDEGGTGGWRLPTVPELFGTLGPDSWHENWGYAWRWGDDSLWTSTAHPDGRGFVVDAVMDAVLASDPSDSHAFTCVRPRYAPSLDSRERFVGLRDGTAFDRATGLAWRPDPIGTPGSVEDGAKACAALGRAWRLPRIEELLSVLVFGDSAASSRRWPAELGEADGATPECAWSTTFRRALGDESEGTFRVDLVTGEAAPADASLVEAGALCVRETTDGDGVKDDGSASGTPGDWPCRDTDQTGCDDNCPGVFNPDQEDRDLDGLGDACDPCTFGAPGDGCVDRCLYRRECADGACGAVEIDGVLITCGWCPGDERCVGGACRAASCDDDDDCASSDGPFLPLGLVRRCDVGSATCGFGLAYDAEVLTRLQRLYRGAAAYYGRVDRLTAGGTPEPCLFPANQAVTPIEGTCCAVHGGPSGSPDRDGDNRCDADPAAWDNPAWADLGYVMQSTHAATYDWTRVFDCGATPAPGEALFEVHAYEDLDCDARLDTVTVTGKAGSQAHTLAAPEVSVTLLGPSQQTTDAVLLTPDQRAGFLPPAGTISLNPYDAEVSANLARLADAAAAYYEAQPAGACAFPAAQGVTPIEGTCCAMLGGPDLNDDDWCDADTPVWSTPTWLALGFSLDTPHKHLYAFDVPASHLGDDVSPPKGTVPIAAYGDLDCDTVQSTFVRFVRGEASAAGCKASIVPGMFLRAENE